MGGSTGAGRRLLAGAALAAAAAAALAVPASAARDDLDLVSQSTAGAPADAASAAPAVSADGRYVAFASEADNMGPQFSPTSDVFVRDLLGRTTTLVSRAATPADGYSDDPSISADGTRVAFTSEATNLPVDDDVLPAVFVRDVSAGATLLASRADGAAGAAADGVSRDPAISADGRRVAFVSDAEGLADGAEQGVANIYVRDLAAGTTTLVSRADGPDGAGALSSSSAPAISADGSRVAFLSTAPNLSSEDPAGARSVFVRDLAAGTTTLASRATGPAGAVAGGQSASSPSISADGTRVAFGSSSPVLSDEDADGVASVHVRDLAAATTTLASRADGPSGAGADGGAFESAISGDGLRVAFRSTATNLSAEDADPVADVFVRDLAAGTTTLASRAAGAAGAPGDADSAEPSLSGDGRFVAFSSAALTLAPVPLGTGSHIFRRDVTPLPVVAPPPALTQSVAVAPGRAVRRARCAGRPATIVGTARRDVLRGTRRADVIAALGGDDVVLGAGGNDIVCLGTGNDRAHGGRGADVIRGGPGRDLMLGGPGPDLLIGNGALDLARGGHGADLCRTEGRLSC